MLIMEKAIEALKTKIEKTMGREMKTPRDFDFLSARIYGFTKVHLSPTTLKRLWGYLQKEQNHKPQVFTLNTLAKTAGYVDWKAFRQSIDEEGDSDFIINESLKVSALMPGDRIRLLWNPDRAVTIRFEGMDTELFLTTVSVMPKSSCWMIIVLNMLA